MHWTPSQITCYNCSTTGNSANDTDSSKFLMQPKILMGPSWKLRKIEIHTCLKCGAVHTFPRYGEVFKIAETKTGRCSEWSMLFGAFLSSVSLQSRIVHDYLDHCWNEVLIDGKWIHVDSTLQYPISLNHPHYYEQNWGKKYLYVLAFDGDKVEDVTHEYSEQWNSVLMRRKHQRSKINNNDEGVSCKGQDSISMQHLLKIYSDIV